MYFSYLTSITFQVRVLGLRCVEKETDRVFSLCWRLLRHGGRDGLPTKAKEKTSPGYCWYWQCLAAGKEEEADLALL